MKKAFSYSYRFKHQLQREQNDSVHLSLIPFSSLPFPLQPSICEWWHVPGWLTPSIRLLSYGTAVARAEGPFDFFCDIPLLSTTFSLSQKGRWGELVKDGKIDASSSSSSSSYSNRFSIQAKYTYVHVWSRSRGKRHLVVCPTTTKKAWLYLPFPYYLLLFRYTA